MSFDQAFQHTVGVEGGYSFNVNDPGGETMWGITVGVARAHGYQGAMKDLPIQTAKDIYRVGFWLLIHLDLVDGISPAIAAKLFDMAVNMGASVPVPFLQHWLNALNRQGQDYPDIVADGLIGVTTVNALRAYMSKRGALGEKVMIAGLNADQAVRYRTIVDGRPASEEFLFGWLANRVAPG